VLGQRAHLGVGPLINGAICNADGEPGALVAHAQQRERLGPWQPVRHIARRQLRRPGRIAGDQIVEPPDRDENGGGVRQARLKPGGVAAQVVAAIERLREVEMRPRSQ
jgi:hypothetical protein